MDRAHDAAAKADAHLISSKSHNYLPRFLIAELAALTALASLPVDFSTLLATAAHCFFSAGVFTFLFFLGASDGFQGMSAPGVTREGTTMAQLILHLSCLPNLLLVLLL
jgi:hypothetical protein